MAYVILATVKADGTKTARIYGGSSRPFAQNLAEGRLKAGRITDYQTAECDDLTDVKSCLMSNFGIGFYNAARPQLREIERRLRDEAQAWVEGLPPCEQPSDRDDYALLVRDDDLSDWKVDTHGVSIDAARDRRDKLRCAGIRFANMSIQKLPSAAA